MTELLERAFEAARMLSPDVQDEVAHVVLTLVDQDRSVIVLTPDEEADLLTAQVEREHGDFASEAEVEAVMSKYRG